MNRQRGFWLVAIGLFVIAISINRAMTIGGYPAGDIRNEPAFWIVVSAAFIALGGLSIVSGIKQLRGG